jgi:hypothetical protein
MQQLLGVEAVQGKQGVRNTAHAVATTQALA